MTAKEREFLIDFLAGEMCSLETVRKAMVAHVSVLRETAKEATEKCDGRLRADSEDAAYFFGLILNAI